MICHQYKCIFIHNRKTGGTSVSDSFGIQAPSPEFYHMNEGVLSDEFKNDTTGYIRFTVVRNPWDRLISGWKFCPSTCGKSLVEHLSNPPVEGWDYRHTLRPQHETLYQNGRLIAQCVLRFEHLQRDVDLLCDTLGKPRVPLAHINATSRTRYQDYFDAETIILAEPYVARDAELFGYAYEQG